MAAALQHISSTVKSQVMGHSILK